MKKYLLLILMIITALACRATDYYLDPTSVAGTANGAFLTPWKTLSALQSARNSIVAGDNIYFKRGTTITGTLLWDNLYSAAPSGNNIAPITFAAYGAGARPKILYPGTSQSKNNVAFIFRVINYVTFRDLNFTDDVVLPLNDRVSTAHMAVGIQLGDYPSGNNTYNKVIDCDFSNIGHGVVIIGNNNLVQGCTMVDLKNIVNTVFVNSQTQYEDYGSVGVTITGSDNSVIGCVMQHLWSESSDFGYNGGAIEMYHAGHGDRNKAMYNIFDDCNGVAEFGADPSKNSTAVDNLFAYNEIINCGALSYVNQNPSFSIQCSNIQYFDNDIVEQNGVSRYSGSNSGAGIVASLALSHWSSQQWLLEGGGGQTATVVYNYRNNIAKINTGMKPGTSSTLSKTQHPNNIWQMSGSSNLTGYTLAAGEISTSSAIWVNTTNGNAINWDFNLIDGSQAIDNGVPVGLYTALNGPVKGNPDIGAYEYNTVVIPTPGPNTFILVNPSLQKYILKLAP